jgi:NADPH:quinone reductase
VVDPNGVIGGNRAGCVASARVRAVTVEDGNLAVADRTDPEPGKGEILVSVRAAGVNGADMMQRKGRYPAPPGSPADILGLELAGEVVGLGEGALRFKEGDRVMAVVGGGGQAELAVLHERSAMPVPESLDWPGAGGTPEVFTTAHDALFTQTGLRAGEHLLVHGAAGGVGTAAVQLGHAAGARVTATVRNEAHREQVAALGANAIAPGGFEDFGPFDVILELVGAPNLESNLNALATLGRIVIIGISAGAKGDLHLGALMGKRGSIRGSTLRSRPLEEKAAAMRAVEKHVLPLFDRGALKVPIAEIFPLEEAADAYERFERGGKFGKIVLVTS